MNKKELIKAVSQKAEETQTLSEKLINATLETIEEALARGEKIQLVGNFSLEVKERAARVGNNPKTNEKIQIPATKVVKFKASKQWKEIVAGK